jgi:F-type H+-transporting ATPase subunit b
LLSINYSFFVQLAIFLALVFILKRFMFNPLMDLWDKRDQLIEGNKQKSEELTAKVDRLIVEYQFKVLDKKKQMAVEADKKRKQASSEQDDIIAKLRTSSNEMIAELREKIASEFKDARSRLQADSQAMGQKIAEKILGASVAE